MQKYDNNEFDNEDMGQGIENLANNDKDRAVIIFTRVPTPGKTKTRMMPFLSENQCSQLHSNFILDTVVEAIKTKVDIFIFYTPGEDTEYLMEIINKLEYDTTKIKYYPQEGQDIGKRMENAFLKLFNSGYKYITLIGTDIPEVTHEILMESFNQLKNSDIVLNPTLDGGYYLISMKENHSEIWNIESYGLNTVIEDTIDKIRRLNLSHCIGDTMQDMDTKEDLLDLYKRIRIIYKDENKIIYTKKYILDNLKIKLDELL